MTVEEFKTKLENGVIIRCENVEQRAGVLMMLKTLGYRLNRNTESYLGSEYSDETYMHPGFTKEYQTICCYRIIPDAHEILSFWDLGDLLPSAQELVLPDEEEFDSSLRTLLFAK